MPVSHPLLGRRPARSGPSVALLPGQPALTLACGRLHESCGPARRTLALWLAGQTTGTVLWIAPRWMQDRLHPGGMVNWADPGRFLFVDADRAEDVLWALEEALRSGAAPLVIGDLPGPPGLTQVRRMHLAAETGGTQGPHLPLGLLLTPGQGGTQGVESRWHLAPDHAIPPPPDPEPGPLHRGKAGQWRLTRLRARTAPVACWTIAGPARQDALRVKAA